MSAHNLPAPVAGPDPADAPRPLPPGDGARVSYEDVLHARCVALSAVVGKLAGRLEAVAWDAPQPQKAELVAFVESMWSAFYAALARKDCP